ncbi:MAG: metallophosphoesterase [Bacteroidota bacterium]|nr:metallophosphoesterase [Bacteroidota bacterium]
MREKIVLYFLVLQLLIVSGGIAQYIVPSSYSNMHFNVKGDLVFTTSTNSIVSLETKGQYQLSDFLNKVVGGTNGLHFDFKNENFEGKLAYGFINDGEWKYPLPVYFYTTLDIVKGKAFVNIKDEMRGKYDMIGWEKSGVGTIGYRVTTNDGKILYDGKISFKGFGPFNIDNTIIEGPFINKLTANSVVISFETNNKVIAHIEIGEKRHSDKKAVFHHEILIKELVAATKYDYKLITDETFQNYSFKTAPEKGSRTKFTFAYASDSRHAQGGGERNVYGTNAYIMKKIMAVSSMKEAAFVQFTGDLVSGYLIDKDEMNLQYANWKRAIEPFAHYMPVYTAMGNHEVLMRVFRDDNKGRAFLIDRFPFNTESSEAIFANNFVNPENGPDSEDGATYDPNSRTIDFPTYKENVYFYTYDNVAVVVLNSDYWYAPSLIASINTSGNLHGYLMENQIAWLRNVIKKLEKDGDIDHIFITHHTPVFPNGGHISDAMWYSGNNLPRAVVSNKPLKKGIIECRDEYLGIIVNESDKVLAVLTGDEHNYNRLKISPEMIKYPETWDKSKLKLNRTIYQINNGAAGAPYYAQEKAPWSENVGYFSTQNAVVFFKIDGKKVVMEVFNPDTLEKFDEFILRE